MTYNYIVDHIPVSTPNDRRPNEKMKAEYITIHNTGNEKSSAKGERGWLTNPSNNRQASFHLAVDENNVVECLPLDEHAWHCGDGHGKGNMTSIGIEICESGNYAKTVENAIQLTAKLLSERKWGVDKLRRHFDWSGKICPRLMYDDGNWDTWKEFKKQVEAELKKLGVKPIVAKPEVKPSVKPSKTPTKPKESFPIVKYSSNGKYVEKLQKLLKDRGYNITVDGDFGTKTTIAVKEFQRANGLTQDGVVGENTWKKLLENPQMYGVATGDVWLHSKADLTEASRRVILHKGEKVIIVKGGTADMHNTDKGYVSKKYILLKKDK